MVEYQCKRCGYTTVHKHALVRHLQRKKQCLPLISDVACIDILEEYTIQQPEKEVEITCAICHKSFNDRSNRNKHQRLCQFGKANEINDLFNIIRSLQDKVAYLETKEPSQTIINNDHSITNNVNIVNIQPFLNERLDHISHDDLNSYATNAEGGFVELIKKIYFSKDAPENKNIRYKSTKQKIIETFDDDDWVEHNADWVLDKMISKGYTILSKHMLDKFDAVAISNDDFERNTFMRCILDEMKGPNTHKYYKVKREIFIVVKNESGRGEVVRLAPLSDESID